MAENPESSTQDPHEADEALKKRLLSRIAVAGVLVVALLGGLAVVDALYGPPQHKTAPAEEADKLAEDGTAKPEEKAAETPAEKPAESAPAEKSGEAAPAEKPAEAAPAEKKEEAKPEVPAAAERPPAAVTMAPPPARRLTVPATARPASIKPSAPVAVPQKPEVEKEIAKTAPPPSAIAQHAPASRPLTQAAASRRQYVVQMGVFNNLANAEDLRAKLELAGIPSQIEARVQVGPFSTRQEAEAAREKLRTLGMDTGMLTAIKR